MAMSDIPARKRIYSEDDIWYEDGGMTTLDNDQARALMSKALAMVPEQVTELIIDTCLIHLFQKDNDGEYLPASLIEGKAIILLDRSMLEESEEYQIRLLLHECAHRILDHKWGLKSETDHDRQEAEAWALVDKWIGPAVELTKMERESRPELEPG